MIYLLTNKYRHAAEYARRHGLTPSQVVVICGAAGMEKVHGLRDVEVLDVSRPDGGERLLEMHRELRARGCKTIRKDAYAP